MASRTPDHDGAPTPSSEHSGKGRRGGGQYQDDIHELMKQNPFHTPSDEEIFILRDLDRRKRQEERRQNSLLKVHEKQTWASKMSTCSRAIKLQEVADEEDGGSLAERKRKKMHGLVQAANAAIAKDRRKEKENMSEFIAKKRDMFLVQMALDTKRAEIRKLEEQAAQREEALKKSEALLDEDAVRFEQFLRGSDQKMVEAIKRADTESKAKMDKLAEIKKLNLLIAQVKSDMSKYEEQLDDCKKYKEFLDELTPDEWKKEMADKAAAKIEAAARAKQAAKDAKLAALEAERAAAQEAAENEKKEKGDKGKKAKPKAKKVEAVAHEEAAVEEEEEEEATPEAEEEMQMYFAAPVQLLEIFTELEERNLFLIQNSQDTETALDELRGKLHETSLQMTGESDSLTQQINSLTQSIAEQEQKAQSLADRAAKTTPQADPHKSSEAHPAQSEEESETEQLKQLNVFVAEVYKQVGFENDANIQTLQMLSNVESKLEEYLFTRDKMPEQYVKEKEQQKEKERRSRVREEKLEQARQLQEAKIKKSLARAAAPVMKKTGKPLMERSAPAARKKREDDSGHQGGDDEEDIKSFFAP